TDTLAISETLPDLSNLFRVGLSPLNIALVVQELVSAELGVEKLHHRPGQIPIHGVVSRVSPAADRPRNQVLDLRGGHHERSDTVTLGLLNNRVVGAPENEVLVQAAELFP